LDRSLQALLEGYARDPASRWVCGGFGALAEFNFDPGEPVSFAAGDAIGAATARGAFRLEMTPGLKPVAYETLARSAMRWGQGLVLCLPQQDAHLGARTAITELGPDRAAIRADDRGSLLFDLGIGKPQSDICVRSGDPATIARLRAACGHALFSREAAALLADMPALSPHRVFRSKVARVEVYQPIPPTDGKTPDGPHTHVRPQLVGHRRSHAATVPIPAGWSPVLWLFPAHPLDGDALDLERFEAFQALLRRFGPPTTREGKAAYASGAREDSLASRSARYAFRIAQRQAAICDADRARRAGRHPAG
jgi:hypothetical protein